MDACTLRVALFTLLFSLMSAMLSISIGRSSWPVQGLNLLLRGRKGYRSYALHEHEEMGPQKQDPAIYALAFSPYWHLYASGAATALPINTYGSRCP